MKPLAEKNKIGESALPTEATDAFLIRAEPRRDVRRQAVEHGQGSSVFGEHRAEPLKGEEEGGERPRHDGALLIGPGKLQGMVAEFFE